MKYLVSFLVALLGTGQCAYADWLHRHGFNEGHYGADGWNLYGSVFLVVGLAAFVVFAYLDIRTTALVIDQAKKATRLAGRRF